jgi:GNAT superfamily N-acetyltransferase
MFAIRLATAEDLPALRELIPLSARELSRGFYSPEQIESAIHFVFGPDSRLIADRTYFVAETDGGLVACGGWSRRRTLYGGDQMKAEADPPLDPSTEAARIRAFFVHPAFARRGLGAAILRSCMDAARAAGFRRLELAATLPGVPLYQAFGFEARERLEAPLPNGVLLPIIRMERDLDEG